MIRTAVESFKRVRLPLDMVTSSVVLETYSQLAFPCLDILDYRRHRTLKIIASLSAARGRFFNPVSLVVDVGVTSHAVMH